MSLMPEPIKAVPPSASTSLIAPSGAMAKADTDPAPLPVKPKRPSAVTTAQHGAPWCVETAPLTSAGVPLALVSGAVRSEEHTSELQSQSNLVCRLLLEKKKTSCSALCISAVTTYV